MTPKEAAALARRAVACPRWRWMPGMLDQYDRRVLDVNTGRNLGIPVWWTDAVGGDCYEMYEDPDRARIEWSDAVPVLSDSATLGCLLALVREARGLHDVGLEYDFGDRRWNGHEYWTDETPPRVIITLLAPASLVALLEGGE